MLHISTKPRHKNSPRPAAKSCPQYQQWARGRDCACGGTNPLCDNQSIQFAHGPDPATKGIGTKSTDTVGMPLSAVCHRLQHMIGWPRFAAQYLPGDAPEVCVAYWKSWPGRVAFERKQEAGQ